MYSVSAVKFLRLSIVQEMINFFDLFLNKDVCSFADIVAYHQTEKTDCGR